MDINPTPFNINQSVRVKLTDHGKKLLLDDYLALMGHYGRNVYEFHLPKEDMNGYVKYQLWDLMKTFGPHINIGTEMPFEAEIQLLPFS